MDANPREKVQRVEAQEFISRFRSKEDLYRYLTQQGLTLSSLITSSVVGLFLPSMDGTKIAFLRAILCEEKKAFKNHEVRIMDVPNYPEISVTNLYDDAMGDDEVA